MSMLFKMSQMTGLKLVHFMAIWYLGISLFIWKYDSAKKMNHECHKPGVILDLDLFGLYSLNIRKIKQPDYLFEEQTSVT